MATAPTAQLQSWTTFLGSTVALILGWLAMASGVSAAAQNNPNGLEVVVGPIILLGAMAYRSRKRTQLGLRQPSEIRTILEAFALIVVVLMVVLQNNLGDRLYRDPFTNLLIPGWVIAAYLILRAGHSASAPRDEMTAGLQCPDCRLFCPEGAVQCDCGYYFSHAPLPTKKSRRPQERAEETEVDSDDGLEWWERVAGAKSCAQCGRANGSTCVTCDCGYEFRP
jgi:hypothetical protein